MSAKRIFVREAQPSDAPAVCEYLAELIAEDLPVLVLFDQAPSREVEERFLRRSLESPNSVFLLALVGERVVGQLDFSGGWQSRRAHAGSISMSVQQSFRGRGVGTTLLKRLFAWIEQHPTVCRADLEVLSNNPNARRLYERLGFHLEGRREAAVVVDGQPIDAILMARLWPKKALR